MGIKHMNIFEGEFRFIFEQININFSNNSKKSLKKYELSHQQKFQKIFSDEIRINKCQKSGKVKLE